MLSMHEQQTALEAAGLIPPGFRTDTVVQRRAMQKVINLVFERAGHPNDHWMAMAQDALSIEQPETRAYLIRVAAAVLALAETQGWSRRTPPLA